MKTADKFFNDVDYVSIIDTVKGIFTSESSLRTLLDFERVLDEADLYAYKNWLIGELVNGPVVKRYTVTCTFLYPYHLMPDPRGAKRLFILGCKVFFKKTKIEVPVEVLDYDDFIAGTRFPKSKGKKVWLVTIVMPKELMKEIKEGSIDLAGQTIDLEDLEDGFDKDYDEIQNEDDGEQDSQDQQQPAGAL